MRLSYRLLLSLLLVLLMLPASAQGDNILQSGIPRFGEITPAQPQAVFFYDAKPGEQVVLEVGAVTEGLAVQITVGDPGGVLLRAVDNPQQTMSLRDTFAFPSAGLYTIIVESVTGVGGQFIIQVTSETPATVGPQTGDSCPVMVNEVLTLVDQSCRDTGRNEACYGNVLVEASGRDDGPPIQFVATGDRANLVDVESFYTAPLDVTAGTWGVALMRLQANLPATLPGQAVTMLVFGDVAIQNQGGAENAVTLTGVATANVNMRGGPSTSYNVVSTVGIGAAIVADGRQADNSWVHIRLENGLEGWVAVQYAALSGDLNMLPVIGADGSAGGYGPMQAFTFQTGVGAAACREAPRDGILLQTPQGVGKVELLVNEVSIQLGSTAFLQAVPGQDLTVSTLEGAAVISSQNVTQVAVAGTQVRVPLGGDLRPVGPPNPPEPLDLEIVESAPVRLLPEVITLPQPVIVPIATSTPAIVLPTLPTTGPCVVATRNAFEVNVRSLPSLDGSILDTLNPEEIYDVFGRTSDSSWFEVGTGEWVAASVTRLGGDCTQVPVTYTGPVGTEEPEIEPTSPVYQIAGDNEHRRVPVDALKNFGNPVYVSGAISYPEGDTQDTVTYYLLNVGQTHQSLALTYSIRCFGDGTENAFIDFQDGSTRSCNAEGYNFIQPMYSGAPTTGGFTIVLRGGDNLYINWEVSFNFIDY